MSNSRYLKLVEPRLATKIFMIGVCSELRAKLPDLPDELPAVLRDWGNYDRKASISPSAGRGITWLPTSSPVD